MDIMTIKNQKVSSGLRKEILKQVIYWSDGRLEHYFFDFKYRGKWISSRFINNELTKMVVEIF